MQYDAPASRPAAIPADAIGFLSTRKRTGRVAAFRPNGDLLNTWGFDRDEALAALATGGFTVDAAGIIRAGR
jgi:hypothetical protein